jgi:4-coumarate--CoA ligase
MLVHPTLVPVAVDTLQEHLKFTKQDIKRRTVIMAQKKDVPAQLAKYGLLDLDDILAGCEPLASLPERFDGKDAQSIAAIYFSSGNCLPLSSRVLFDILPGTTGLSKAVGLSHYNLVAFLNQVAASWPYYVHGQAILQATVPLYHVLGGLVLVLYSFYIGVPVVILPGFQPELFLESIQKYKITVSFTHALALSCLR